MTTPAKNLASQKAYRQRKGVQYTTYMRECQRRRRAINKGADPSSLPVLSINDFRKTGKTKSNNTTKVLGAGAKAGITRKIKKALAEAKRKGIVLSRQDKAGITNKARKEAFKNFSLTKLSKPKKIKIKKAIKEHKSGFYNNVVGIGKRQWRLNMAEAFRSSEKNYGIVGGNVLTLCASKFILEKLLHSYFPHFKFLACEFKREVYVSLKRMIGRERNKGGNYMLNPLNVDIRTIIDVSVKNQFAHLILDFCGVLNTFSDDIKIAIEKNIVQKGGIVAITVSCNRNTGGKTEQKLRDLIDFAGKGAYEIVNEQNYNDTGTKMYALIIRRKH